MNGTQIESDSELVSAEEWIAVATEYRLTNRELEALVLLVRDLRRRASREHYISA